MINRIKEMSQGKCCICQGIFPDDQMTKHLEICPDRHRGTEVPRQRAFHLLVEGRYQPEYWMHLEIPANATFKKLDQFLRNIWVECCGHLSAFSIQPASPDEIRMNARVGDILETGMKFYYEYDFGSTTELALKVISEEQSDAKDKSIRLLARNEPPQIKCSVCDKSATQVCTQCIDENTGWLCDHCAPGHECGEDMLSPVVNSPRVGVCGYTHRT